MEWWCLYAVQLLARLLTVAKVSLPCQNHFNRKSHASDAGFSVADMGVGGDAV
ncbi:MAG: hypothetical protein R3E32_07530 [Chitinophagales bacterium]